VVNASKVEFTEDCYNAPANKPLTVTFTNNLSTTKDNTPLPLTLIISSSKNPAVSLTSNGLIAVDGDKALFLSDPTSGEPATTFVVKSLPPGEYDIQTFEAPMETDATLIVEG